MFKNRRNSTEPYEPRHPVDYPEGIALRVGHDYWYIKAGKKYRFFNDRVFDSWSLTAVPTTDSALAEFPSGGTLGFRTGSLIRNEADGTLWYIDAGKRRQVVNPDVHWLFGIQFLPVIRAAKTEIEFHEQGEDLD